MALSAAQKRQIASLLAEGWTLEAISKRVKASYSTVKRLKKRIATAVRRIMHSTTRPLKPMRSQALSPQTAAARLRWCLLMRRRLRLGAGKRLSCRQKTPDGPPLIGARLLWTDEAMVRLNRSDTRARVWIDRKITKKKALTLPELTPHLRSTTKQAWTAGVMVSVLLGARGFGTRPHFLPQGVKLDAQLWTEVCEDWLWPECLNLMQGRFTPVICLDNAPSHAARVAQAWYQANPAVEVLFQPPSSPDLSPLDFWFWSRLKAEIVPQDTVAALKCEIAVKYDMVVERDLGACLQLLPAFERRLDACIRAGGWHFEHSDHVTPAS